MNRVRVEVEEYTETGGRHGVVLYLDDDTIATPDARQLKPIIDQAVIDLAAQTGHTTSWARDALFATLVLRIADIAAYDRETARRGVLAL